ncbi:MAG: hypothetical protein IAE83_22200 [Anaerolinea sp.]|nr:hypothetical protein [Anaerolinea sp.]
MKAVLLSLILGLVLILGNAAPVEAQGPTKDRCRDDQGNEICTHYYEIDGRVNPNDALATTTAYCRGGSIEVWAINNSHGQYAFTAPQSAIVDAMGQAQGSGSVRLIGEAIGQQLVALPDGQLQIQNVNGYRFPFSSLLCGIPVPPPSRPRVISTQAAPGVILPTSPTLVITPGGVPLPAPDAPEIPAQKYTQVRINGGAFILLLPPGANFTTFTTDVLNFRTEALLARSTYQGEIPQGTKLQVMGRDTTGRWLYVLYRGVYGFVVTAYTTFTPETIPLVPVVVFQ